MLVITLCRVRDGYWLGRRSRLMKYQLQYKFRGCKCWFLGHEADNYDEVYGYWDCNPEEFIGMSVRIVKVETTVLAEIQ